MMQNGYRTPPSLAPLTLEVQEKLNLSAAETEGLSLREVSPLWICNYKSLFRYVRTLSCTMSQMQTGTADQSCIFSQTERCLTSEAEILRRRIF